jgi:endonuclease/exonuclease/phosphatase family metal-dependent hydrolase
LRVVTYNIAGGHGHSPDKIAAVLHPLDADVICLQEVFQLPRALLPPNAPPTTTQAHLIAERLRMNCVFGEALVMRGLSYGNATLSRFRLHSARHVPLPRGSLTRDDGTRMPGAEEPRLALAVTVSPSDDVLQAIHIVNAHLGIYNRSEAVPGGPACQAPATIAAFCNELPRRYEPTVLLGDLNATPESVVLEAFAQSWTVAAAGKGPTTKKREIDHVLTRNCQVSAQRVLTWAETHAGTDSPASDHLPVVATCVVPTWAVSGPVVNHYLKGYVSGRDGVYTFSTLSDAVMAARAAWTAGCRGVTQEAADRFTLRSSSELVPSVRGETSWTLRLR